MVGPRQHSSEASSTFRCGAPCGIPQHMPTFHPTQASRCEEVQAVMSCHVALVPSCACAC